MKTIAFTPEQLSKAKQYIDWNFDDAQILYNGRELIIIYTNNDAAEALLNASLDAMVTHGMSFAKTDIHAIIDLQINN